jgi:hypothetical protein
LNHLDGDYKSGSAADSLVEQKLSGLPQGKSIFIRVRSFNQKARSSPLSNEVQIVTAPDRQLVLRNGPAAGVDTPAYTGSHVTYVHSKSPQEPAKRNGNTVAVNAPGTDGHRVVLVRFDNLPQLGDVERATLELTLPPEEYFQLPGYCDVSCFKFRPDWDPAQATYAAAAPGKPWTPEELIGGDKFLSRTPQDPVLTRTPVLRWDVSDAVRSAAKSGAGTVSLLVRVDDTGHYVSGKGYTFCDAEHPAINLRPRLRVITH